MGAGKPHITPARFEDLPSVLDVEQAGDVLRCSRARVYELRRDGLLGSLGYSRTLLFDAREVRRFLREATTREVKR